jgi:hypothetical protein
MYHVTHLLVRALHRDGGPPAIPGEAVAIRAAGPADAKALAALAETDSAPRAAARLARLAADPAEGAVLVADIDGHPVAALDVARDNAVADPFEPTARIVELLRLRARQLAHP